MYTFSRKVNERSPSSKEEGHSSPSFPSNPATGMSPLLTPDMNVAPPYYICGPTASGKSALAIQLAREIDGEIVNADAFQLYPGLEVLTAAPSLAGA